MKYLKHICLFTLVILLSASCVDTEDYRRFQVDELEISKSDPNFHIYLCFGQSNMEGNAAIENIDKEGVSSRFRMMAVSPDDEEHLGRIAGEWYTAVPPLCRWDTGLTPIDYFGRTMVAETPDNVKVGVIMVAMGGAGIDAFDKEKYKKYYGEADDWQKGLMNIYGGNPYAKLVEMAKIAKQSGVIKGILLHQGETNNMQEDWPMKVNKIYTDLLKDLTLNGDTVPLLIGEMLTEEQGGICHGMNSIITKMPSLVKNAHVISAEGCPGKEDGLHFTAEGYRELGKRYAQKMLQLLVLDKAEGMPKLHIEGRYLKDSEGNIVNLHGFAQTYSPYFNESMWSNYDVDACLRYNQGLIRRMLAAGWEMDFIRLHMDPYWSNTPGCQATGENDIHCFEEARFKKYLDQVFVPMAEYAISKGMYVVMRPPGVCPEEIAVDDDYNEYLVTVWDIVSKHPKIKNNSHIMFELANEPVRIVGSDGIAGGDGDPCFTSLKKYFQKVVDAIRANADNIIWVPGLGYQSNYSGYVSHRIEGDNIGYAVHLYPGWMNSDGENGDGGSSTGGYQPFQNGWDRQVGPVADFAPIIITEMDWAPARYNASWGKAITGTLGGPGFGANFKYIVDNAGNVSWLLFTSPHLLADFKDVPGTPGAYTFLDDPQACPWPIYHWFQDYRKGTSDTGALKDITVEGAEAGITLTTGSSSYLMVYANYEDGSTSIVSSKSSFSCSDPSIISIDGTGKMTALKDGNVTITVTYGEASGIKTATVAVHATTFPLSADAFNPSIWETGTYDETTHTLITGSYGFGGWEYTNGVDLSGYKYLVVKLGNDNIADVKFRLFDKGYWEGAASYAFGNSRKVVVELKKMKKEDSGAILSPKSIKIIGFWSNGGKPIIINDIYLSNDDAENPVKDYFSFDNLNPNIWDPNKPTGSFEPKTGTLITGSYGFGGWEYDSAVDFSGYHYLVAELGEGTEATDVAFRVFDKGYWDGEAASVTFNNSRTAVIDLKSLSKNGSKVDPSLKIVGFWSSGGKKIVIKRVYLTDIVEQPGDFSFDDFNPSIWETGSFDRKTHTFIAGQYGFGGWQYSAGKDLSTHKYLVAELVSMEDTDDVAFRIFDEGYWNGAVGDVKVDKTTLRAVIDLTNLSKEKEGIMTKVSPNSINIIGFWSMGGKEVVINRVYLTDTKAK